MKPFASVQSLAVVAAVFSAGCSTPKAALNLADKTAGNVALLNKNISAYADDQQQLISQRIAISANLAQLFAELSARTQVRMDSMRLAGMTTELSLVSGIIEASQAAATNQALLLQVPATQNKLMSDGQLQLQIYNTQLKSLAESLSQLANDDDLKTRLANLAAYAQAVKASMDASRTNTSAAKISADTKSLADRTAAEISKLPAN